MEWRSAITDSWRGPFHADLGQVVSCTGGTGVGAPDDGSTDPPFSAGRHFPRGAYTVFTSAGGESATLQEPRRQSSQMNTLPLPNSAVEPSGRALTGWRGQALAFAATCLLALILTPLHDVLDHANTAMLFLLVVALVAFRLGRRAAILATFASVALFDFFFIPPRFSFAVSNAQYLVVFAVMLVVALIITRLTAGLQRSAEEAIAREARMRSLNGLAQSLAGALSHLEVAQATQTYLRIGFQATSWLFVAGRDDRVKLVEEGSHVPMLVEHAAAQRVFNHRESMEFDDMTDADAHCLYLPLSVATHTRGVLAVAIPREFVETLTEQRPLIEAMASLVATAVERVHLVELAHESQIGMVSERLRSSVLSALSHDVRTPLAALFGLADSLVVAHPPLPPAARETASAIRDQAARLDGMVGNLLDMARLQCGAVTLRKEWQPLEEVIGASINLLGSSLAQHEIRVSLPRDLPPLEFDAVLLERVFCNLLENAAKYSLPGAPIGISAEAQTDVVVIEVRNPGTGFPPERLQGVFDLFERGAPESAVPGVGVGLAICRAVVEAHGGSIGAFNPDEGGACVRFTLPRGTPPTIETESVAAGAQ
jgi:two-component system sensor histidine kinase KdpD